MTNTTKENFYVGTHACISEKRKILGYTMTLSSGREIEIKIDEDLEEKIYEQLQKENTIYNIKPIIVSHIDNEVGDYSIEESKFGYTTFNELPSATIYLDFVTRDINTNNKILLHFMMNTICNKQSNGQVFLDLIVKTIGHENDQRYPSIDIKNVSITFNSEKKIDDNPELLTSACFVETLFGNYLSMCEMLNNSKIQ